MIKGHKQRKKRDAKSEEKMIQNVKSNVGDHEEESLHSKHGGNGSGSGSGSGNGSGNGSSSSSSSSSDDILKLRIASIHKKIGGIHKRMNITRALQHFDKAVDMGLFDIDVRKFYAGEESRNFTKSVSSSENTAGNAVDADKGTNENEVKNAHPSISKHQIPRMNHRYRWIAAPSEDVISRSMGNKGMKLRDTGAGSVREIEKTLPIVP